MKSITTRPPRSRRRSWRATSSAASRLVWNAVSSMSPPLVARAELTSIAVSASVWSMTSAPPEGRRTVRSYAFSICDSIWKRLKSGVSSVYCLSLRRLCGITCCTNSRRLVVHLVGVDEDLADVGAHVVAQGADDQARFLVDQEGRGLAQRGFGDRLPDLQQVVEVPLQFFGVAADAGGADDHAHVVGDLQLVHRFLERGAVVALDAARDAAGGRRVRHQHHVAAGQRDERGQGRALVAAFFLVDLDDDFLAFAQEFACRPALFGSTPAWK